MLFVSLQLGDFLRIYNLRAIPGSSKVPGLTSSQSEEVNHLAFHLHGGTAYGRGIRVLPENSPDVQQLKRYGRRGGSNTPDVCAVGCHSFEHFREKFGGFKNRAAT